MLLVTSCVSLPTCLFVEGGGWASECCIFLSIFNLPTTPPPHPPFFIYLFYPLLAVTAYVFGTRTNDNMSTIFFQFAAVESMPDGLRVPNDITCGELEKLRQISPTPQKQKRRKQL